MSTDNAARVTILSQLFYPELISTGQVLTEAAEELSSLGVSVEVICGPSTIVERSRVPREIDHQGIRIHRVLGTRFSKLSTLGKLINLLTFTASATMKVLFSRCKSPLMIVTNPPFLPVAGVLCRWLRGRPYIFLVHDFYPDIPVALGVLRRNGLVHKAWNLLNRILYRNAAAVIVLGERMADVVRQPNKLGPNREDRLNVIHIWCDDRKIHPKPRSSSNLLSKWELEDKFLIQYSGNMGRMHDVETILQSALHFRDDKSIHFQFIGEGYKKAAMQQFVNENELENCSFHPYVPREQLPDSLVAASVGIAALSKEFTGLAVPSKMFGIMASGRPVLALMEQRSETGEIVSEHECGVVVAPGDVEGLVAAILELSSDPDKCSKMGKNGRKAIDEVYSVRKAVEQYRDVILKVAKG